MDCTQYDLDTINMLIASYFKNGEAKTLEDVNRVLALVVKSRTQQTTKAKPSISEIFEEKCRDLAEKEKKSKPGVSWPERSGGLYWGNPNIVLCDAGLSRPNSHPDDIYYGQGAVAT